MTKYISETKPSFSSDTPRDTLSTSCNAESDGGPPNFFGKDTPVEILLREKEQEKKVTRLVWYLLFLIVMVILASRYFQ